MPCTFRHYITSFFYEMGLKCLGEYNYYNSDIVEGCVLVMVRNFALYIRSLYVRKGFLNESISN